MVTPTFSDEDKILDLPAYKGLDDFTTYVAAGDPNDLSQDRDKVERLLRIRPEQRETPKKSYRYTDNIFLGNRREFRSLICPCFRGRYYSLTLRKGENSSKANKEPADTPERPYESLQTNQKESSGYAAVEDIPDPNCDFLFGVWEYVRLIYRLIFKDITERFIERAGLVIVAGSTASAKSRIARGLIDKYMDDLKRLRRSHSLPRALPQRRPHLVTFEDPIETLFYPSPESAIASGFDYTPRQKRMDVASLAEALQDCLRQTPSVVYAGETRDRSDWQDLVDFAGTGHLVFTTCHSGSLTEILGTLSKAVGANTAARRSALASRLVSVIHLRRATVPILKDKENVKSNRGFGHQTKAQENGLPRKEAALPALWVRTQAGINALTSDGLAALLPYSAGLRDSPMCYSYGRSFFARHLLWPDTVDLPDFQGVLKLRAPYSADLTKLACQFDLEGL